MRRRMASRGGIGRPDQAAADPRRPRRRLAGLVDGPRARRPRRLALVAAAVAVINPITWFDSVVWGQVDSFGVVFLLLGVRELWRDQPERAAIFTVIAALIKPQLGHPHPDRRPWSRSGGRCGRTDDAEPGRRPPIGPATALAWTGSGPGSADRPPVPDPDDGPGRLPDRGHRCACRSGCRSSSSRPTRRSSVRPARPDRQGRRRLSVPHGQRLQPVGARARRHGQQPGQRRPVGLRRGPGPPSDVRRRRRACSGRSRRSSSGRPCSSRSIVVVLWSSRAGPTG